MTTAYVQAFTENEVAANERDAAKHSQKCNDDECSLTEYEVEARKRDVADAHTFTAATAMSAKIERRAALDAEIPALEAEIVTAKTKRTEASTKHADARAAMDAEISALEAELAASKTKPNALET